MKKILSALLALIMLLLSSCANGGQESFGNRPTTEWSATNQKVSSSIFGKKVEYNAWSPAENAVLPVDTSEIISTYQIEKVMYILSSGGVYTLDLEAGNSQKIIEASPDFFFVNSEKIYTYDAENRTLSVYDTSGVFLEEFSLDATEANFITGVYVTDNYYVLSGLYLIGYQYATRLYSFDKETKELVNTSSNHSYELQACSYKGNEFITLSEDKAGSALVQIYNAETGKSKKLENIRGVSFVSTNNSIRYNPKTDTLIVYSATSANLGGKTAVITECSLEEQDAIIHQRYKISLPGDGNLFVGVYENIIACITTEEDNIRFFDFQNPPESITIVGYTARLPEEIIHSYEAEYGVMVRFAHIDSDRLVLKLMAGDSDFDLILPNSGLETSIILSDAYEDLAQYENLKLRLSKTQFMTDLTSYRGKYFGVALDPGELCYSKDNWMNLYFTMDNFALVASEFAYYSQNVDEGEGIYKDPNGDELYKFLKFVKNGAPENKMPFGDDLEIYNPYYLMMNRSSVQKDKAVQFLEYVYDALSNEIDCGLEDKYLYPADMPKTDNYTIGWRFMSATARMPVIEARMKVAQADESELKEMAKETARQVRMRLEG
ncbi:MAG: hypothetical protein IKU89_00550 [Oscillospiraceae bacterium]|nr:hypothetical protein [Oscillospiraceae bacterium]